MQDIVQEAGRDKDYKQVTKLIKERRDRNYFKSKLPSEHPARSFLTVWEGLEYEVHPETGTILLVLDTIRICIPRGTDENGKIDGSKSCSTSLNWER